MRTWRVAERRAQQQQQRRNKRGTLRKTVKPQGRTPLTSILTSCPLELVCMDFLSLETSGGGIKNILVLTDHFARHTQAFPTHDQTALTMAHTFWQKYIMASQRGFTQIRGDALKQLLYKVSAPFYAWQRIGRPLTTPKEMG